MDVFFHILITVSDLFVRGSCLRLFVFLSFFIRCSLFVRQWGFSSSLTSSSITSSGLLSPHSLLQQGQYPSLTSGHRRYSSLTGHKRQYHKCPDFSDPDNDISVFVQDIDQVRPLGGRERIRPGHLDDSEDWLIPARYFQWIPLTRVQLMCRLERVDWAGE
ncbi:hypothetical protein C8J56DRAFT_517629 [Mycena floridula]|nr:hypothetical protein C8J56DRAFT_517629 [Mycena floridula]